MIVIKYGVGQITMIVCSEESRLKMEIVDKIKIIPLRIACFG